jgi:prepilin-type N-terminal cleavage/methylation domain-containing protein
MNVKELQRKRQAGLSREAGFSLLELMITLGITLILAVLATTLLASSFNIRSREDQRTSALADAQRALNIMTREIANSGFGLTNNGIVASESTSSTIRMRANLNAFDRETTSNSVSDSDEDIKYSLFNGGGLSYIERLDVYPGTRTTVLANRVDTLRYYYFSDKVTYTSGECTINTDAAEVADKSLTKYIVIVLCVDLPARGTLGQSGYIPASKVQLTSDVTLRNSDLTNY